MIRKNLIGKQSYKYTVNHIAKSIWPRPRPIWRGLLLGLGMDNNLSIEVYLSIDGWAYPGVYTRLGNLPGLNANEKCWTMFGALLKELLERQYYNVTIYHDSRLVDEWYEDVEFISKRSLQIAARLKNDFAPRFSTLEISKLDQRTIRGEQERLKLA